MNNFDLNTINKEKPIYFIGIGGISMSALAVILKRYGFIVRGSDFKQSEMTDFLLESGIEVIIGHDEENVADPSLVVYTAAIKEDNPELKLAKTLNIPVIERAVLLGSIMKQFENPVAVSGTHGKTTTTSMLAQVLLTAGLDPTVLVGGILPSIGGNLRDGGRKYLITEACEYCGSFLKFNPRLSIILNVEEDHLDYFKDINDIIECFRQFVLLTPEDGAVIVNIDDKNAAAATIGTQKRIISYGIDSPLAMYRAADIEYTPSGRSSFNVLYKGGFLFRAELNVPGEHNVKNALATIAAAVKLGVPAEKIKEGLSTFNGTDRRFERKGTYNGALVIDDYAHHPTEIKATLSSAKSIIASGRIFCIFQPHTYTRSLKLKDEFAESFSDCDTVIVTDIYAAREKDNGLISSKDLSDAINKVTGNSVYIKNFEDIATFIEDVAKEGDIIMTMGAGDVYKVCDLIL